MKTILIIYKNNSIYYLEIFIINNLIFVINVCLIAIYILRINVNYIKHRILIYK